jgi:hypothetical protein
MSGVGLDKNRDTEHAVLWYFCTNMEALISDTAVHFK